MSFMINVSTYIHKNLRKLSHFLLPPSCVLCGWQAHKYNLCTACFQNLPIIPDSCYRCGFFMKGIKKNTPCGRCINKPPPFDVTFSLFPYEQPIIEMIIGLKFKKDLSYARVLGELFCEAVDGWYAKMDKPKIIIPVPLHDNRLRERGFNQSLEIARFISNTKGITIDYSSVIRIKETKAQSELNAEERQKNLSQAFAAQACFNGKAVIILDDVITTGSTILELSKVIKENGASLIHVWCCARR